MKNRGRPTVIYNEIRHINPSFSRMFSLLTLSLLSFVMYTLNRQTDCVDGFAFYVCSHNNFRGCCSTDPCALSNCPDVAISSSMSPTTLSLSIVTTSFGMSSTILFPPGVTTATTTTLSSVAPLASNSNMGNNGEEISPPWIGLIVGLGLVAIIGIVFLTICMRRRFKLKPASSGMLCHGEMAACQVLTLHRSTRNDGAARSH